MNNFKYTVKTEKGDLVAIIESESYLRLLENLSSDYKSIKPIFKNNQGFNFGDYTAIDKHNGRSVIVTLN